MYHSSGDGTVSYAPVPGYVANQCARGANITFATVPGLNHTAAAGAYYGEAYVFLEQAFNGTLGDLATSCTNRTGIQPMPGTPEFAAAIGPQAAALF